MLSPAEENSLEDDSETFDERSWRIIAPADNWRHPLVVSNETLETVVTVAERLGLVATRDSLHRKFYLRIGHSVESRPTLTYPSGEKLDVVSLTGSQAERYAPAVAEAAAPLVEGDPGTLLSEHFALGEFLPGDSSYRYLRVLPALIELLEAMRAELGGHPLVVNSGYRPPDYNARIGGVRLSTHIDGLAADISCAEVPVARLFEVADQLVGDRGGVGRYPYQQFVHVDLRGSRVRWTS